MRILDCLGLFGCTWVKLWLRHELAWIGISGACQEKAEQQERAKQLQEQLLAAQQAAQEKVQAKMDEHLPEDERLTETDPVDTLFRIQANIQYEALKVNVPLFENEAFDALLKEEVEASGIKYV